MESSSSAAAPKTAASLSPRSQDLLSLDVNVTRLPPSVTNLVDCVAHEIQVIEDELNQCYDERHGQQTIIESLEDAIDDGFMCVDLKVLEQKLKVWHELFSPCLQDHNNSNNNNNNNNNNNHNYTVTPFFAVKCNPDPLVVEWLARSSWKANLPLGFDCASMAELELAKKNIDKYSLSSIGTARAVPTTRIVYANPQRAEADLIKAMELFATTTTPTTTPRYELWLTLDGVEEVYKIAIAKERFRHKHHALQMPAIKIVLRIWVPDGHSQVPLGEKFGMRLDQIPEILQTCLDQGIAPKDIIGISFHCGSGCESVETYLEALEMGKTALQAMDSVLADEKDLPSHRCWLMDIGGGFPGVDGLYGDQGRFATSVAAETVATEEKKEADDCSTAALQVKPQTTVADIAVAVCSVLHSFANGGTNTNNSVPLTLIAEPGRYFVEGAFALASKIYQKQMLLPSTTENETNGNDSIRVYRIPHGVQGVFKDVLLCGESFVPQPLSQKGESQQQQTQKLYPSRVLGPSGDDSEDVVCDVCWLPELEIGDWLVFDRMGAYTLSIASRAGRPVMRYVIGGASER